MRYIPESFQIFGKTVPTVIETEVDMHGYKGHCNAYQGQIELNLDQDDDCDEEVEATYLHEVVHVLLFELGYPELSEDELLVDRLSKGMHQFLSTSGIWLDEEVYSFDEEDEDGEELILDCNCMDEEGGD